MDAFRWFLSNFQITNTVSSREIGTPPFIEIAVFDEDRSRDDGFGNQFIAPGANIYRASVSNRTNEEGHAIYQFLCSHLDRPFFIFNPLKNGDESTYSPGNPLGRLPVILSGRVARQQPQDGLLTSYTGLTFKEVKL